MVSQTAASGQISASDAETLEIVSSLAQELHPHLRAEPPLGLEAELDRDFGLDSLGRVEAVHRLELAFNVRLPDRLFAEAATAADLARAVCGVGVQPSPTAAQVTARSAPLAGPSPSTVMTFPEVLAWHADHHGERAHVYLSDGDVEAAPITYAGLLDGARAVAAALAREGLEPGARVALMLPTGEAFLAVFFGVLLAGGVPAPIYPPWRMAQIEEHLRRQGRVLGKARAAGLIASREVLPFARLLRDLMGGEAFVLAAEDLPAAGDSAAAPATARPEALALIQFTSGSTADPKGVMLSHANILANIRGLARAIAATPGDVYVSWLPLYHDMGLIAAWLACVDQAVPLVLMSPLSFLARPERWLWTLHRNRATITAAPNFAFELCLSIPDERLTGLDLSDLRVAGCGSEPISPTTVRDFTARFASYGFRAEALLPVYGLAESAAALTSCPLGRAPWIDHVRRTVLARTGEARLAPAEAPDAQAFVSCGVPLLGHEARVVDEAGREAGERREGRLQFRGPSATAGYFEAPNKTAELICGDWLDSGDLAYVAQGEVFVTGRTKDMIKRAGRNIHPADIEDAVADLAGVEPRGTVLFSVTDPERGVERLVLAVETALPAADRGSLVRSIQELAADRLQAALDDIFFLDPGEIPRTESGKVRRAALGQAYLERDRAGARAAPKRQLARLVRAALAARLRRHLAAAVERLYAAYWWAVIGSFGLVLWPLLPPLSLHRRWQAMHGASRLALRLLGHSLTLEVIGPRPDRDVVYVANHASYIDSLVLAAVLPGDLAFTGFKALAEDRIQGTFVARLGTLFVERFEPGEAVADTERATDAVRAGRPLVIFPEATAMRAPGLLDFRMGAFVVATETGAPVVPITIRGTRSILRHDHRWFPRRGEISVRIGAALAPQGRDFEAALALKSAARAEILAHLGEPDLAAEAPQF
ncbi:MAG: AMP-binding protein [Phenylobacterium sp.]